MSNNAPDYNDNLVFPPEGDWADTNPRANTDRTASTIELVIKIEELNKWLDLKSEYIEKLERQIKDANNVILNIEEQTGTVFQSALEYYEKYGIYENIEEKDE